MRERVLTVMGTVFAVAPADIPPAASIETVEQWDSLSHLELMLEIEMEFGVRISSEAMPTLISLDAIEGLLREQGVAA